MLSVSAERGTLTALALESKKKPGGRRRRALNKESDVCLSLI